MNTPQDKSETQEKFQSLLRELFQFDLADLDFGIYRIMNHKRQVIERWIEEDLPQAIREEFKKGALAEQQQLAEELATVREEIQETAEKLGVEAFDADDNLSAFWHDKPIGQKYLALQAKAAHAQPSEALEAAVYNHLYTFFSRYYQDGDFISKRRYSKKERYAIPYNGEEVYLYWANHDQYYVKTAEHFTDYTWKAPNGVTVHFKLQAANVEVNNVKSEKRFFLPVLDGMTWDAEARALTIPFEYRPLTEQEKITYGKSKQQDRIIAEALERILPRLKDNAEALEALTAERRKDAQGRPVSWLAHHLRQYTARNTRDFFIHKDLKGFLSRELDFYLKNEVLNLDELEAAGEGMVAGWFQLMRLIKRIGNHIIDFLTQIEDFQKALWEKKKFVTETFYIVTVGNIPEDFYPEIAANEAQWEEWEQLGMLNDESGMMNVEERTAFITQHPSLPLDTRHFSPHFTDRLLTSFDPSAGSGQDLDEVTDGLLVHSENWGTLNLLQEKYRARVKTIYIDPPYNTEQDRQQGKFLYKDSYEHSSWVGMMHDRLLAGREWMQDDGVLFVSCDENEQPRARLCGDSVFGENNYVTDVIWNARKSVSSDTLISLAHHHTLFWARSKQAVDASKHSFRLPAEEEKFSNPDNDPHGPWTLDPFDAAEIRPNLTYEIMNPNTGDRHLPPPGRHWRVPKEEFERLLAEGRILFGKTGTGKPMLKRYWSEAKQKGCSGPLILDMW